MSFLVDIKTSILPRYRTQTQVLLFDGARAHTCNDSQAFMQGYFKPLQIPVMSCEFNCKYSIQLSSSKFSLIKHKFLGPRHQFQIKIHSKYTNIWALGAPDLPSEALFSGSKPLPKKNSGYLLRFLFFWPLGKNKT